MLKYALAGLLSLGIFLCSWTRVEAAEISAEKLKAYADIYPEVFQSTLQQASYRPASGNKSRAVALLLESYQGNTDVDALSRALNGRYEEDQTLKTERQIKALLAAKGLQWEEYLALTHQIAKDPKLFQDFSQQVDRNRLQRDLFARASIDENFIRMIQSLDHQIIVRNLLASNFRKE